MQKNSKQSVCGFLMLSTLSLTGCDYISKHLPTSLFPTTKTVAVEEAKQEIKIVQDGNIVIEKVTGDDIPSSENIIETIALTDTNLIEPVETIQTTPPAPIPPTVTIEPVKVAKSVKTIQPKNIVTASIPVVTPANNEQQSIKAQLQNLEIRVQKITEILDKMSPAMTRLIGIENEVSNLSLQLQSLIEQNKQQKIVQLPAATPTIEPLIQSSLANPILIEEPNNSSINLIEPAAGTPLIGLNQSVLHKVRTGDHKGKTRLVFESNQKTIPEVSIDNNENIMAVIFEGNNIDTYLQEQIENLSKTSSLIQSTALLEHPDRQSFMIAFDLKNSSHILSEEYIAPGRENNFHRFVLDIKR